MAHAMLVTGIHPRSWLTGVLSYVTDDRPAGSSIFHIQSSNVVAWSGFHICTSLGLFILGSAPTCSHCVIEALFFTFASLMLTAPNLQHLWMAS